jgi:predicted phosphodiesterase
MKTTRFLCLVALLAMISISLVSAAGPNPFTFTVFSDNHGTPPVFKEILTEMDAIQPAFAISCGDFQDGKLKVEDLKVLYQEYKDTVKALFKRKVYLTMGNHEIGDLPEHEKFFSDELGKLYYSFDYENCHFIILDSEIVGQTSRITGDQLVWLKDDLRKSKSAGHIFVFFHKPMYPVDGQLGKSIDKYPAERDALHQLFKDNHVTAVFTGHEHTFNQHVRDGVRYLIIGGAGGQLFPNIFGTGNFYHYIVVHVDGDKVDMKAIKPAFNGKPMEEIRF